MAGSEIGQNYAAALIDSLESTGDIERVERDLETFAGLMRKVPSLAKVLNFPGFDRPKRHRILEEVLEKIAPHPITRRFLRLVVEKDRIGFFNEMLREFEKLSAARRNITPAEVTTVEALDASERAAMEEKLAALAGGEVRVTWRTDASILGGAVARVGSRVYDGSVKKQLERIRGDLLRET